MSDKHQEFYKYQGAGNDFIILHIQHNNYIPGQSIIEKLCDRHFGIGSDGLILISASDRADFRMDYFNADGLESSFCGNGGRCAAAFAFSHGLADRLMLIEAIDGLHQAEVISDNSPLYQIKLNMSHVHSFVNCGDDFIINTGSPHYVKQVKNLGLFDVNTEGKKIRHDQSISSDGINVNFFEMISGIPSIRTFERGVEGETLSCGTGVTASAIAASLWYGGNSFNIQSPGGMLTVNFDRNGDSFENITLEGPAEFVFRGQILIQ
jgi:diaminopimelate epimerase